LTSIDISDLSSVFQDAIEVTAGLGIKYIWIDSLCIIQDDINDWVRESSKMSAVYGRSTLTIFATSTIGCFISREGFEKRKYHYMTHSGQTVQLLAQWPVKHSHVDRSFRSVAAINLFKRGWAFQEWLISSRAIVFGADELLWSCNHAVRCECTPTSYDPRVMCQGAPRPQLDNLLQTRIAFRLETGQDRLEEAPAKDANWLRLAQMYSATRLTVETDRLPALSGLAKRFWTPDKDKVPLSLNDYLAGCWRHQLIPSLLWYSIPPRQPGDLKFIDMTRSGYIAPSWSWLSLPYYVKFIYLTVDGLWNNPSATRKFAIVQNTLCRRATEDPTGTLKGGHITISGPVFDALLAATPNGKRNTKLQLASWQAEVHADHGSRPFSRLFTRNSKPAKVSCLLVQGLLDSRYNPTRYRELGLILLSTGQANCYERVGLFDFNHVVHERKHPEESWGSILGIMASHGLQGVNIDHFIERLQARKNVLPDTVHAVLPRATERRITIV
jgi:hypothetical protein